MEQVTVYTTPTCPWCIKVKDFLREKGVAFEEVDVAHDPAGARRMIELTGQRGVPVTAIGGEVVVGFDRTELERRLPKESV